MEPVGAALQFTLIVLQVMSLWQFLFFVCSNLCFLGLSFMSIHWLPFLVMHWLLTHWTGVMECAGLLVCVCVRVYVYVAPLISPNAISIST